MKTKVLSFIVCICFCLCAHTQSYFKGTVKDEKGNAINSASISLHSYNDSVLLKLTVTDLKGNFRIASMQGMFLLKITAVNFKTRWAEIRDMYKDASEIFTLTASANSLADVSVKTNRPLFQFYADKTILNIDAAPSNTGSSILDVLSKIPDILIDPDGNVTIAGKPGLLIMIDGRETYLSGKDLLNMLKAMPASGSDQIEVITNPSAKYEAVATGGILNIKTKKSLNEGLNGSLNTGAGAVILYDVDDKVKTAPVSRNNVNWNYRKNKINVYGNASYERGYYFENFKTLRNFYDQQTGNPQGSYFSWSHIKTPDNYYQLRVAADITLNKKNLLGFIVNNSYGTSLSKGATNSYVANANEKINYLMRSAIVNPGGQYFNGNYNVNHKYTSADKNIELSSDVSYLTYNNTAETFNETKFVDTLNNPVLNPLYRNQISDNRFEGFVFKSDLVVANRKKLKMEAGYKFSHIKTVNDPLFRRQQNGGLEIDYGRSNHFSYAEDIHGIYTTLSRSFKKTDILAGLRLENAYGKGYQKANDSSFTRNFLNLFPSIFIKQTVSKNYQLVINYSRKVARPGAGQLNPFTYFTDSLYSNSGNPFIQPQFAHVFEFRNIIRNKYSITLAYQYVDNIIMTVVQQDPVFKLTRVGVRNMDNYQVLSLSASAPIRINKWWQSTVSTTAGTNKVKGAAFGFIISESSVYWNMNTTNNLKLSSTWSADVNISAGTPQLSGLLVVTRPVNYSVGLRKSIMQNRGGLTLTAVSPFYVPHYSFDASYGNTEYHSRFSNVNQSWMLSFNYRFGKQTIQQQRTKKNATTEEESRM